MSPLMPLLAAMSKADPSLGRVRPAARRVALLTGQSDPRNTVLSPTQLAFLARVTPAGYDAFAHAFPFHASTECAPYRRPHIVAASLHNARQFAAAALDARFRALLEARLGALVGATSERLVLVTGSCGLQLLNAAWPSLEAGESRVRAVALGPACLGTLTMPSSCLTAIRGRRDGWSRLLYRGAIDHEVDGGHLDYWTSTEVIGLVGTRIASYESEEP